jgi:hypothetical protein
MPITVLVAPGPMEVVTARAAAHPVVGVRQVDPALLVHHLDHLDPVPAIHDGIQQRHVAVAGNPRDVGHPLPDQVLDDDLPTREPHDLTPPECVR